MTKTSGLPLSRMTLMSKKTFYMALKSFTVSNSQAQANNSIPSENCLKASLCLLVNQTSSLNTTVVNSSSIQVIKLILLPRY
jgi:hypothetical protein